jgi:hypothetical protein
MDGQASNGFRTAKAEPDDAAFVSDVRSVEVVRAENAAESVADDEG